MTIIPRIDSDADPELGLALRDLLDDPTRDRLVIARLMVALRSTPQATGIDILATWARPGLAAAAMMAAGLGLWLGMHTTPSGLEDVATVAVTSESMIAAAVGTR